MYNNPSVWKSKLWYTNLEKIKYHTDKNRVSKWLYFQIIRNVYTILGITSLWWDLCAFRKIFIPTVVIRQICYHIAFYILDIIAIIMPPCIVKWKVKYSKYPFHILTRLWAQKIGSLSVNSPIRMSGLTIEIFQKFSSWQHWNDEGLQVKFIKKSFTVLIL